MHEGIGPRREPIGYAVVGLGHIAQSAVLPAFAEAKETRALRLSSREGLADVRIMDALFESARTGRAIPIERGPERAEAAPPAH